MKIEKITKKNKKYTLLIDTGEEIETYEEVLIDKTLLSSKRINEKELNEIKQSTVFYDSYNKVVNMITRKLRSQHEIKEYLIKEKVSNENIIKIMDKLKTINLLNDKKYAETYINDKIHLSMDGPHKIKKHLEENEVDIEIIEESLKVFTYDLIKEKIERIINKKTKEQIKDSEYMFKQKIFIYLNNLGYPREQINESLLNIHIETNIKGIEKIHNTLAKKYSGTELKNKLKNKLYSKGYRPEEINEYIEKI